jgi:hypothetical protein
VNSSVAIEAVLAEPAHARDAPVMHERIEKCSIAGIFFAVL